MFPQCQPRTVYILSEKELTSFCNAWPLRAYPVILRICATALWFCPLFLEIGIQGQAQGHLIRELG